MTTRLDNDKFCRICCKTKSINEFPGFRYMCQGCIESSRKLSAKVTRLKIKTDPVRRLRGQMSKAIHASLKSGQKFSITTYSPYSIQELKEHLENQFEPWMSWSNWGIYDPSIWDDNDTSTWKWQIDHIVPRSHFECSSVNDESFLKCWALSNLRPLNAKQNIIEGCRRNVTY